MTVNSQNKLVCSQSCWAMDAPIDFLQQNVPIAMDCTTSSNENPNVDSGELQNSYTTIHSHNFYTGSLNPLGWPTSWVSGNYTSLGSPGHGPIYARRHTMASVYSFNGISGIQNPQVTVAFEEMWNNAWQDILWQVGGGTPGIGGSLSLTGSNPVLNLLSKSMGDPQLYGGGALWEADILANCQREYDQIISTDSGLLARLKRPISPFYNSYASYNESLRTQNQDYSVLPEFRISEFLDFYIDNGENYFIPNPREFAIPGMTGSQQIWIPGNENNATLVKAENIRNSSQDHFYKVFSNSDFMKHYGRLREDHEPFGAPPTTLTLTCKALMKLLPYDGFFPSERTLQISHLMSQSFGSNIAVQLSGTSNNPLSPVDFGGSLHGENLPGISFLRRPFYSAMMAPGLLYNTIKAGIAVDYPIYNNVAHRYRDEEGILIVASGGFSVTQYTETRGVFTGAGAEFWFDAPTWMYALGTGSNGHQGFDYRIPFEALVDPSNYLSDLPIADMEPHPDATYNYGIIPSSSILDLANYAGRYSGHDEPPGWYSLRNRWNGQFDSVLYERAINNFLAEVPEFFLQDEEFGSIESNPATSFGTVTQGAFYAMRVKLRRTMDKPRIWSSLNRGQNGRSIINFDLPQDPIAFNGIFRQEFYGSSSFTASLDGWSVTLPPAIPPSAVCRENFTMYSNPSAFGPPMSGTGSLAQGYQVENMSIAGKIKRQNQMGIGYRVSDSTNGYYCAFTPPYMDGEAWADIVFEAPRTGRPTLEELQAHSMVILLRVDGMPRLDAEKYASEYVYPYVLSEAGLLALQDQESREWGGNLRQNAIWNATSQSCDEDGLFGNLGEAYDYPIHPYSAVAVNNNAMQLDASLNLFGFKDNKWVIQPKFETPHANFNEIQSSFGHTNPEGTIRRPILGGGDVDVLGSSSCELPDANGLSIPVHGSESVPRGMWHQFGKTDEGKKGIWLECGDIPMTWLRERGYLFPTDPLSGDTFNPSYERPGVPYYRGHWTDQAFKTGKNAWEAGINGALYGMKQGGQSVYNLEGQYPGPLATILGFNKRKRLGRTAQRKKISEGIVAVPFIEQDGRRIFFAIPENVIRIALGDLGASTAASEAVSAASSATEAAMAALEDLVVDGILDTTDQASAASQAAATAAGTMLSQTQSVVPHKTIVDMVNLMKKYIFPPRMDFVKYLGQIRPFAMYIFEFSHELSQCDLSKIWQNVLPEIGEKMVEQEVSISHKLLANQLMGDFKGSAQESMKDQVQWMVFKVKQRANDDYSSKVAAKNPIPRRFGKKKTSSASKYEYSYNWPYDYFSLVEFAKIEATIGFGTESDKSESAVDNRGPGNELLNKGIQATRSLEIPASQQRTATNSLPAGERQQERQEKRKEARQSADAKGPFGNTKKK